MRETWLHSNTRPLRLAMVLAALFWLMGVGLFLTGWAATVGLVVCGPSTLACAALLVALRRPRLAYEAGQLLLYLRPGPPIRVPIDVVEGFLLGQGPTRLPGKQAGRLETATLVIKLAESAEAWNRIEVRPALASWCNHYVTVRGTWTEPLSVALVNRLNVRLDEAKRRQRTPQGAR